MFVLRPALNFSFDRRKQMTCRLVEKWAITLRENATEGKLHPNNTQANFLEVLKGVILLSISGH